MTNQSTTSNEQPLGPLMVDIDGISLSEQDSTFLQHPAVGSVILFSRNFESKRQLSDLVQQIKALRSPSLPIVVDQEGGRVQRFVKEFQRLPPCLEIGKKFDQDAELGQQLAHACGYVMAYELIELGIDFSFAPVLDIANLDSKVIGNRGFHSNPQSICLLAESYIDGMHSAGMQATGKHFPGHGGVIGDSHLMLPEDDRPFEQIDSCDLIPFKHLSKNLTGIMTGHIYFNQIETSIPTYSQFWLQQVLRNQLKFDGVIFSDDLTMQAAGVIDSIAERTIAALTAGCDIAIVCNDRTAALQAAQAIEQQPFFYNGAIEKMRAKTTNSTKFDTARQLIQTHFFN